MAQEIGIRIYKRKNSEKWRPSRLCHFRSAQQPAAGLIKTMLTWPSS